MIVRHSSIRTRLITISIISEFARDKEVRVVFVNDERVVGQICDMAVWGIDWLAMAHENDNDVHERCVFFDNYMFYFSCNFLAEYILLLYRVDGPVDFSFYNFFEIWISFF